MTHQNCISGLNLGRRIRAVAAVGRTLNAARSGRFSSWKAAAYLGDWRAEQSYDGDNWFLANTQLR